MEYKVVDVGTHATPPAEMWRERFPRELRDKAPVPAVRYTEDGEPYEVLVLEGVDRPILAGSLGVHWDDYTNPHGMGRFDDGLDGNRDPVARLADMVLDGVDAQIIVRNNFPNLIPEDRSTWWGIVRAYNDWISEFCATDPLRLIGVAELPVWDIDLAVAEAKRVHALGLRAVLMPIVPGYVGDWSAPADHDYTSPYWEPLWQVLEDLGLTIVAHIDAFAATPAIKSYQGNVFVNLMTSKSVPAEMIASLIVSGVFDRHPRLKVVLNETGVGWAAHFIPWADVLMRQQWRIYKPLGLKLTAKEYFNRHVIASFLWDSCGVATRDIIGVESIAWCSDYPENYGTFPDSKSQQNKDLAGTTPGERHAILAGNAVRTFAL